MSNIPEVWLRGIYTILQRQPHKFKSFGPYWWWIKRQLKTAYPGALFFLVPAAKADDPQVTATLLKEHGDVEKMWLAAIRHHQRAVTGGFDDPYGVMPDGATYYLADPDMAVGNFYR